MTDEDIMVLWSVRFDYDQKIEEFEAAVHEFYCNSDRNWYNGPSYTKEDFDEKEGAEAALS